MKKPKYVPRVLGDKKAEPFQDTEEAWFWYIRCQKARQDGARFEHGMGQTVRPCDPDDIYRIVLALFRAGRLKRRQLNALIRFGFLERPPDARCREEADDARYWDFALDAMTTVLKTKGLLRNDSHPARNEKSADE